MARVPEEESKRRKKPYRKPEIKSGKFLEKKALACAKTPGGGGGCASGFVS